LDSYRILAPDREINRNSEIGRTWFTKLSEKNNLINSFFEPDEELPIEEFDGNFPQVDSESEGEIEPEQERIILDELSNGIF
jgi:hypothetical protein